MTSIFQAGLVIDRFELLEFVGEGAQAEIWKIKDLDFPRRNNIALKIWYVPLDDRSNPEFAKRSKRLEYEVDLLGNVESNFVVTPYRKVGGTEVVDGVEYIWYGVTMPLASERSLNLFQKVHHVNLADLDRLHMMEHLARGLSEIQSLSIIHNDIKPQNILISKRRYGFEPSYADFGLAFKLGEPPCGGGTPLYMAPEVEMDGGGASFAADVFALGVVFCEIMTGTHPFSEFVGQGDVRKAVKAYYASHSEIDFNGSILAGNDDVARTIRRMCAFKLQDRASIEHVIEMLEVCVSKERRNFTANVARIYPDVANCFHWAGGVHAALHETERLIFLRGSKPNNDVDYIADSLKEQRLFGFSIFRLFGSYDYLVRLWLHDGDEAKLEEVLRNCEVHVGQHHMMQPKFRWPHSKADAVIAAKPVGEILDEINALVLDHSDRQIAIAKRNGLIVGVSKRTHERGVKRRAIRAICRATTKSMVKDDVVPNIGNTLFSAINGQRMFREVEVLIQPGDRNVPGEFVIIAELSNFHNFREVLLTFEKTLAGFNIEGAQFRSLFEMDDKSRNESYDGAIFHELHQRRHSK